MERTPASAVRLLGEGVRLRSNAGFVGVNVKFHETIVSAMVNWCDMAGVVDSPLCVGAPRWWATR